MSPVNTVRYLHPDSGHGEHRDRGLGLGSKAGGPGDSETGVLPRKAVAWGGRRGWGGVERQLRGGVDVRTEVSGLNPGAKVTALLPQSASPGPLPGAS